MGTKVVRFLSLLALAGLALAACAAPTAAPGTEALPSATSASAAVEALESPTAEATLELIGTIERMTPAAWTLNGSLLAILPQTEIRGSFRVGDMVKAYAALQSDGSLAAREIEAVSAEDPSTLPGAEFDLTGVVEAIAVDEWTVAGHTFAVTSQTEINGTFAIGDLVKVHLVSGVDGTLVAREIEAPDDALAAAPQGAEVELVGLIDSIAPDQWVVGGWVLAVTPQTEIHGTLAVGDAAKVHIIVGANGALTAREIEPAEVGDVGEHGDDDNANANQNANGNENGNANQNANTNQNGNENENENDNSGGNGNSNSSGSG